VISASLHDNQQGSFEKKEKVIFKYPTPDTRERHELGEQNMGIVSIHDGPNSISNTLVPAFVVALFSVGVLCGENAISEDMKAYATVKKIPSVLTHWMRLATTGDISVGRVLVVKAYKNKVYIGTEDGLAYVDRKTMQVRRLDVLNGLPFPIVSSIDVDPRTDDVWIGTFGSGLVRLSAGRTDKWNQLNSGLANDVVTGVVVDDERIWVATLAGASVFDTQSRVWEIFNQRNMPCEENCYTGVWRAARSVYLGVGRGGLLLHDSVTRSWSRYLDEEGVALIDSGAPRASDKALVTGVAGEGGIVWVTTRHGVLCRRDKQWLSLDIAARDGEGATYGGVAARSSDEVWFLANDGAHVLTGAVDSPDRAWIHYRTFGDRAGSATAIRAGRVIDVVQSNGTWPIGAINSIDFDEKGVWLGSDEGLFLATQFGPSTVVDGVPKEQRHAPEDTRIDTVKIGLVAPLLAAYSSRKLPKEDMGGQSMLNGAQLAVEDANALGGFRGQGIPYTLIARSDQSAWGSVANEVVKLVYRDSVWAILGTKSDDRSHVLAHATTMDPVLVVNAASSDPTLTRLGFPWIACIYPNAEIVLRRALSDIVRARGFRRLGFVFQRDRRGRAVAAFAGRVVRTTAVFVEMPYYGDYVDFMREVERIKAERLDAIVFWGEAKAGAAFLRKLREYGLRLPFFASERCRDKEFVAKAKPDDEDIWIVSAWDPTRNDRRLRSFQEAYRRRFGGKPDLLAAFAYDGMNGIVWAIEKGGLNRKAIIDALMSRVDSWDGVTGSVALDYRSNMERELYWATLERGEWRYSPMRHATSFGGSAE
jgi:branched-chain amino acid transport system substrate-binding protein